MTFRKPLRRAGSAFVAELWELDECSVTMLRGVAYVGDKACKVDVDLSRADAVLTIGGDEGEEPSVHVVPVAISPEVRQALNEALRGDTMFYVGQNLRCMDYGLPFREMGKQRVDES